MKLNDEVGKTVKPEPTPGRTANPVGADAEKIPALQTKKLPSTYTAFPHLKALDLSELKMPELPSPKRTENDSPLRMILVTQVLEGAENLRGMFGLLQFGSGGPPDQFAFIMAGLETFPAAARLEGTSLGRVRWHEALIKWLKRVELSTESAYQGGLNWLDGKDPRDLDRFDRDSFYIHRAAFHFARFYRLGAEAELLKLNESLAADAPPVIICPPPVPECRPRLLLRRWR